MNVELIFYAGPGLLESPVWDDKNSIIYCVSIEKGIIYQINQNSGFVRSYPTDGQVGCIVIDDKGYILSAEEAGIFKIDPESGERIFKVHPNKDFRMRYNDGKLDPVGRFIVGTKGLFKDYVGEAAVYSLDRNNNVASKVITETTISNGIGFSGDNRYMYFADTFTQKVGKYCYDVKTGNAEFQCHIISLDGEAFPDGMCVDIDEMIWVAEWGGGKICKWNPETGKKLCEILLPCKYVTSCCLGGKDLDTLFITTASGNDGANLGGGLFSVNIKPYR